MPYLAGQFIIVELPDGVRRAYSMSRRYCDDAANAGCELEVIVRAKPGGAATEWLFGRLCEQAEIIIEGPYGMAHLQSPPDRPIVAIAGGSGLGPMLAVTEQAVADSAERPVYLYVGSRVQADRICLDELAAFGDAGVAVHHAVEHDPPADCRPGLVGDLVDADWDDLSDLDLYLCGPAGMVDACLAQLVRSGKAAADRVFFDRFQ
jgi:NAD(P)H-flavin reductase